jgi:predicted amidohydrolase
MRGDWTDRRDYLNPGQEHYPVFDTPWGKAGFLICTSSPSSSLTEGWDLSHPTAAQDLVQQGADIIFAPAYWLGIDSEPYVPFPISTTTHSWSLLLSLFTLLQHASILRPSSISISHQIPRSLVLWGKSTVQGSIRTISLSSRATCFFLIPLVYLPIIICPSKSQNVFNQRISGA